MRLRVVRPEPEDDTVRMGPPAGAASPPPRDAVAPRPRRAAVPPAATSTGASPAAPVGRKRFLALGLAGGALIAGAVAWMLWPRPAPLPPPLAVPAAPRRARVAAVPAPVASVPAPVAAPVPAPAAPAAPAPVFTLRSATRRQILADNPDHLAIFRYAPNPNIVVLDFPSLRMQGLMLDRVAALIEKGGLPRNRVISWAHLRRVIAAGGDTISTYYYGHDYSAAALARFFALAAADHRRLNPEEQRLHALIVQLGWLRPGVNAGLITLPRAGANKYVTQTARDVILTHELSHGEFFSSPAYRAYVRHFWQHDLTAAQREAVRHFLGSEEYDTRDETLMMNEMQAYLMFTRNPEFFQARDVGMTPDERRALQNRFVSGMPVGWLRNRLVALDAADRAVVQIAPPADRRASSAGSRPSHLQ
ncbi:MAG: hypothetical protein ACP5NP_07000 [Acetobacteraceae bacterium]